MIDLIDAAGRQTIDLRVVENSQGDRYRERQLAFDLHDRFADALQQPHRRAAHRDHDAELAGAALVRGARRGDELLDAREPLRARRRWRSARSASKNCNSPDSRRFLAL